MHFIKNLQFVYTSSKYKSSMESITTAYFRNKTHFLYTDLNVSFFDLSILLLYINNIHALKAYMNVTIIFFLMDLINR